MLEKEKDRYIVYAMGKDRAGLVARITKVISNAGFNIVDIEQSAPHGLFYIIMIIEPTGNSIKDPLNYFNKRFIEISAGVDLNVFISEFREGIRKPIKWWSEIVFVGPDKPGLIAELSDFIGKNDVNIHRLNMIARGEIIAAEMLLDISSLLNDEEFHKKFNENLKKLGESLGLQIIIQEEDVFKAKRKMLILDLDENLIYIIGLLDFFKNLNIDNFSKEFRYDIESVQDIRQSKELFLRYLKNMDVDILTKVIGAVKISPDTEELIRALKLMNYKIALISNSLNIFTDLLKVQLGIDYAFGNALEINNNKLNGNFVKELIITPLKKQRIINWLANMEKIPEAEVYLFGLDVKEPFHSYSTGLKISINFDYSALKKIIDSKQISIESLISIIINIGIQKEQFEQLKKFILSFR